jgi:hypothetical protein
MRFCRTKGLGLHLTRCNWHKSIQQNWTAGVPVAYNLSALHQYVTGHPATVSHRAMADVKATITVLFYQIFWQNRGKFFFSYGRPEELQTVVVGAAATAVQATNGDDSDTSVGDDS